jgi:hypothetical protein
MASSAKMPSCLPPQLVMAWLPIRDVAAALRVSKDWCGASEPLFQAIAARHGRKREESWRAAVRRFFCEPFGDNFLTYSSKQHVIDGGSAKRRASHPNVYICFRCKPVLRELRRTDAPPYCCNMGTSGCVGRFDCCWRRPPRTEYKRGDASPHVHGVSQGLPS